MTGNPCIHEAAELPNFSSLLTYFGGPAHRIYLYSNRIRSFVTYDLLCVAAEGERKKKHVELIHYSLIFKNPWESVTHLDFYEALCVG